MTLTNNVHSKLKDAHFGDWKLAEILQSPNHFSQNGPFSPVIMEPHEQNYYPRGSGACKVGMAS